MNCRRAAVIGAGSQGRVHAAAYRRSPVAELVAVADPDAAAAERLEAPAVIADHRDLLASVQPDIVSVCTPPAYHADIVCDAAEAGVAAIHCEKPLATSPADVRRMLQATERAGVRFSVNLQRRFHPVHRFARDRIAGGAIGDVVSIEGHCPNLFDWGSHIVDLILFHRRDAAPQWVMGQVDVSVNHFVYGAFVETSAVCHVGWADGVRATVITGHDAKKSLTRIGIVVHGTRGRAVVNDATCLIERFGEPPVRFDSPFSGEKPWHGVDPGIVAGTAAAIDDLLDASRSGRAPALDARLGAIGSDIIFGCYDSSRARARVPLPLQSTDNALEYGMAQGFWSPSGELRSTY